MPGMDVALWSPVAHSRQGYLVDEGTPRSFKTAAFGRSFFFLLTGKLRLAHPGSCPRLSSVRLASKLAVYAAEPLKALQCTANRRAADLESSRNDLISQAYKAIHLQQLKRAASNAVLLLEAAGAAERPRSCCKLRQ